MKKFDKLFTLFEQTYGELESDFDPNALDDFDYDQFTRGDDDFQTADVGTTGLVEYTYKLTELAILESLDTGLKPLMIYGESGIGKSKMIKSIAKEVIAPDKGLKFVEWKNTPVNTKKEAVTNPEWMKEHYMLIDIRAAELEPVDIRGIEMPSNKMPYLDPKVPLWIHYAADPNSHGVLFFDEMNQAMRQVFNALFGVILDRQAGDLQFSDNWSIIAASNLGKKHTTTQTLPIALTQRFDTIYLVANPEAWAEWALQKDNKGLTRLEPEVVTYALSDPDSTFLVETNANSSQSCPNPRNLEMFSRRMRMIKYYYLHPEKAKGKKWITGNIYADLRRSGIQTCGREWTDGFIQFVKVYNKLDWEDLAKNAKQYASKEMEQIYAYMYYIAKKVVDKLGYGRPLNQKIYALAEAAKAGKPTNESEWKEGKVFIQQLAKICAYLIYQAENSDATAGQENLTGQLEKELQGEGEHLATLFSLIKATDPARKLPNTERGFPQEAIVLIGILAAKYQSLDPDVRTLLLALKQIQSFGKL